MAEMTNQRLRARAGEVAEREITVSVFCKMPVREGVFEEAGAALAKSGR